MRAPEYTPLGSSTYRPGRLANDNKTTGSTELGAGDRTVSLSVSIDNVPATEAPPDEVRLSALAPVLDHLDEGVVLVKPPEEEPFYHNRAARRLLAENADRTFLTQELRDLSRLVLRTAQIGQQGQPASAGQDRAPQVSARDVESVAGGYRLRATLLEQVITELRGRAVLVTIDRLVAPLPSRAALMRRFWLTAREADVALLLAQGMRNSAIARALSLSPHTARHYTENVLLKVGVHARAEVVLAVLSLAHGSEHRDRDL